MNVSIASSHKNHGPSPALSVARLPENSFAEPGPAPALESALEPTSGPHGSDQHLSSAPTVKHGLSPLKVISLHGAVMAVEHGVHFSLHKSVHYASASALQKAPTQGSATLHTLGDVAGASAAGYLAYRAIEHALHASSAGHSDAAVAYSVSAALDAGLAVANTLAAFKQIPSVSIGVSLGVGLLSTASSVLGAKLEQTKPVSH